LVTSDVKLIDNSFSDVVAIGAFNEYLYVADKAKGFFAVEVFGNDEFSEARPLKLEYENGKAGLEATPAAVAMVVFALNALLNASLSLGTTVLVTIAGLV